MHRPEIETPLPSMLGGEKGERGEKTNHAGRLADHIAGSLKVHREGYRKGYREGYRARRYQAHAQGRSVLRREAGRMIASSQTTAAFAGDVFRTVDCMTVRRGYFVNVHKQVDSASASYSGLVTCGSVWACPICAAKIQERRRGEIEQGMSAMQAAGFAPVMVTFTFPHRSFQSLADLIGKQARAFMLLRSGREWQQLKARYGFGGLIRSLEVTHGSNGWHPHTHELWFVAPGQEAADLRANILALWARACVRAGLLDDGHSSAFLAHAVDVRANVDCGDYLAKQDDSRSWGMADEIAKATSKEGRAKGVHPHHFLIRCATGDDALFVEYVRGMKGRRQLFWSHGLKAKCGIGDVTDEELADAIEQGAYLLALIPAPAWRYVVGNDARCEVLDAAEVGGFDAVCALLRSLGVPEGAMPIRPGEQLAA